MSKPPMKVVWIFSTFGLDAPARRFAAIVGRLGDAYEHVIGSMSGDFEAEALIPDGVRWRRIDLPRAKRGGVSVKNMWTFRKILASERPNLLVTSNWESIEWLMVNRGPGAAAHVHFEDSFGREERLDIDDAKRAWSRRRALPGRRRAFVASSRDLVQAFSEIWGASAADVHHIPLGVDLDLFPQRDHTAERKQIVLGAAGPLIAARRFDRLIRMTATLAERGRDVRAVILGDGPEKKNLITEAETAGVSNRIEFVGAVSGCARVFSEIDVYVAAGEAQRDASGLLAAMASGLPIVGLEADDVREMVDASNRLFIRPSGDESGMAAAAELIVSDTDLRIRLGRSNRVKAENDFDIGAIAKRYDELFRATAGVSNYLALPAPSESGAPSKEQPPATRENAESSIDADQKTAEDAPRSNRTARARVRSSGADAPESSVNGVSFDKLEDQPESRRAIAIAPPATAGAAPRRSGQSEGYTPAA